MFDSKSQRNISYMILGIYVVLLIWLILFKFNINFSDLSYIRNINLIPFKESMIVNGHVDIKEIIYNILVFVPLGVYVSMLKPDWSFLKKAMLALSVSLLFEILQFIFAIGASDITDIIGNTTGGIIGIGIGIGIFFALGKVFKQKYITIINAIGLAVEIFAMVMLGILFMANI